jgi:hypothetical protein
LIDTLRQRTDQFAAWYSTSTRFQGIFTIAVVILIPTYIIVGWLNSVSALAIVSLSTWLDGRTNNWATTRVAKHQAEDADVAEVKELIEQKL